MLPKTLQPSITHSSWEAVLGRSLDPPFAGPKAEPMAAMWAWTSDPGLKCFPLVALRLSRLQSSLET